MKYICCIEFTPFFWVPWLIHRSRLLHVRQRPSLMVRFTEHIRSDLALVSSRIQSASLSRRLQSMKRPQSLIPSSMIHSTFSDIQFVLKPSLHSLKSKTQSSSLLSVNATSHRSLRLSSMFSLLSQSKSTLWSPHSVIRRLSSSFQRRFVLKMSLLDLLPSECLVGNRFSRSMFLHAPICFIYYKLFTLLFYSLIL